jgi:hypothetical protein
MLEEHVEFSGRKGVEMLLEGRNEGTNRFQGPTSVAAWTAARTPCSLFNFGLPFMLWAFGAPPPDFFLSPSCDVFGFEMTILRWMPFFREIRVCGRKTVGFHYSQSGAARTTSTQPGPAGNRCLPFMVIRHWTFPPHFPRARSNNLFGCDRTIFRRVPLFRKIGVRGSQAIGFDCFEVLTARAPAAHVGSADNLSLPLMILCRGAFPPDLPTAARGNVPRS